MSVLFALAPVALFASVALPVLTINRSNRARAAEIVCESMTHHNDALEELAADASISGGMKDLIFEISAASFDDQISSRLVKALNRHEKVETSNAASSLALSFITELKELPEASQFLAIRAIFTALDVAVNLNGLNGISEPADMSSDFKAALAAMQQDVWNVIARFGRSTALATA